MRKGDTIGGFLKAVREQLAPQFRELRAVSGDSLMYIKVGGGAVGGDCSEGEEGWAKGALGWGSGVGW